MRKPNCRDAERKMTPEQGARYQRMLTLWMEYWETGNNFGGRYFRDFDLEADLQAAIGSFCDEVNGLVEPPPRKPPMTDLGNLG